MNCFEFLYKANSAQLITLGLVFFWRRTLTFEYYRYFIFIYLRSEILYSKKQLVNCFSFLELNILCHDSFLT